jgi:methionine synthase I (cobalamin-dependent)
LNKRASEAHPIGQVSANGTNSAKKHSTMETKNPAEQSRLLNEILRERILVLDGAMGTMIQKRDLSAQDFGGAKLEGCNENLVITRPDVISDIHRMYLKAGADIIETNSFGSTPMVLAEYGLGDKAYEISRKSAELARAAADEMSTSGKPRFVAGSMGPTTRAITLIVGGITFDELRANLSGHAEHQGSYAGDRTTCAGTRAQNSVDGFSDD